MGSDEKSKDSAETRKQRLEWRDYVALLIASLQTVLLPFVLLLFVMIFFGILLHVLIVR